MYSDQLFKLYSTNIIPTTNLQLAPLKLRSQLSFHLLKTQISDTLNMNKRGDSFKKSETIRGEMASSMLQIDQTTSYPPDHRYYPTRKSLSTNFPTSPDQPTLGEGILHFTHSHPLSQLTQPDPFTCSGCKEYGAGKRFSCQECDFQLHDFCALSPPVLKTHPLHPQHQLVFHAKPKAGT